MQTQTIKIELFINGQKVVIGYQFLEDIASGIPDIKENQAIFDILAFSDNLKVRESISSNNSLSKKSIDFLWENTQNMMSIVSCNEIKWSDLC